MDLAQLRTFIRVADSGSFTRAAEQSYLTQPAVSQQIKRLELELGQELLRREGKRIRTSYAGEVLLEYAHRITALADEAAACLADLAGGENGRVSLAAIGTTTVYVLPDILYRFRMDHPGIQIVLRTWGAEEIETLVEAGDVDLGIVGSHISTAGFTTIPLFNDTVIPVVHPGHPLAAVGEARLADLAKEPLILFGGWKNWTEYVMSIFHEIRVEPRADLQVDSIEAVKRMVGLGLGFTIIPAIAAEEEIENGQLVGLRLTDIRPVERQIMLIYREGRRLSPAARLLVDAVVTRCQEMGREDKSPRVLPPSPSAPGDRR